MKKFDESKSHYSARTALAALVLAFLTFLPLPMIAAEPRAVNDPYLWLEDVSGKKALDWVKERNTKSTKALESSPQFESTRKKILEILNSKDHIPQVSKKGPYYYNFWRDEKNVRGLWRRTTLEEFKKTNPKWETVIDLDKLAADEKENWVWAGCSFLEPGYERGLVSLSRGGLDAEVVREFDIEKKEFVKDGFNLPEAKSTVAWRNRDSIYVGTDFGPKSMTSSGYPRIIKEWKRGTPLSQASTVFEGKDTDVAVSASVSHDHGITYEFIERGITFFSGETFVRREDKWVQVDKPNDATFGTYAQYGTVNLRTDWTVAGKTYKAGSLLIENFEDFMKGDRSFDVLFEPTERKSLLSSSETKNYIILTEMDNVRTKAYFVNRKNGNWVRTPVEAPALDDVSIWGIDSDESDDYFMTIQGFLTPSSLFYGTVGQNNREKLKSEPSFFNTEGLQVQQFEAKSKDGTSVPYFQVSKKDIQHDGSNPTLLYGYGGFEIPLLSSYSPAIGAAWLERGGVYVRANIRGGGEFGPKWHEAARKENRQRAYDDFIAIAEDLIARKVTSPKHLGIEGRSNGGLLMGVMLTQRPDLFAAVHCGSPLLDMYRYSKLLAGASWMDEYGDPDKEDQWAYISRYSPYQNLKKESKYPPMLITTSTLDDRVHPGHARKMTARMEEQGHNVLYYENIEGGHGAAANKAQSAFMDALAYEFLWNKLK